MSNSTRITIFADDSGNQPSQDALWVQSWLKRWRDQVRIANYSSGGWEQIWDVEGPPEAIAQVPGHLLVTSEWSNPTLFGK